MAFFPFMPSEIRSKHKGVCLAILESDEAGYYRFWYQIGDHTFHGKTETRLAGIAGRGKDAAVQVAVSGVRGSDHKWLKHRAIASG